MGLKATASSTQPFAAATITKAATLPGVALGAGLAGLYFLPGTTGGTAKLVVIAGTSLTPVVIADNIGAGF